MEDSPGNPRKRKTWKSFFGISTSSSTPDHGNAEQSYRPRSTLGILSDKETDEVPGTVVLSSFIFFDIVAAIAKKSTQDHFYYSPQTVMNLWD